MRKSTVDISSIINFLFVLFLILWVYNDFNSSVSKMYKYVVFFVIILIAVIFVARRGYVELINRKLTYSFLFYGFSIFVISFALQLINNQDNPNFYFRYLQLVSPFVFIYLIYNLGGKEEMMKLIDYMFIILAVGYVIHIIPNLSLANLRAFNFSASSSAFEGINYADNFIQLFIFYYLFDERKSKARIVISFVLNFFCFKRFHVVYSVFILLLGKKLKNVRASEKAINLGVVVLMLLPVIVHYVFNNYVDISSSYSVNNSNPLTILTGGRNVFIKMFLDADVPSIGVGGTDYNVNIVTGGWVDGLHMDFLTMYFDTTVIGLFAFVNMLANCLRTNKKILLILGFLIIDMCVNPIITNLPAWIQFFAIFFFLYQEDDETDEYMSAQDVFDAL